MKHILLSLLISLLSLSALAETKGKPMKPEKVKVPQEIVEIAPEFAALTQDVLFADIWERPGLSKRDKSLVTITVLASTGKTEQMEGHFKRGYENGLTKAKMVAALTHIAFYAGWPSAMSGLAKLKNVSDELGK